MFLKLTVEFRQTSVSFTVDQLFDPVFGDLNLRFGKSGYKKSCRASRDLSNEYLYECFR